MSAERCTHDFICDSKYLYYYMKYNSEYRTAMHLCKENLSSYESLFCFEKRTVHFCIKFGATFFENMIELYELEHFVNLIFELSIVHLMSGMTVHTYLLFIDFSEYLTTMRLYGRNLSSYRSVFFIKMERSFLVKHLRAFF